MKIIVFEATGGVGKSVVQQGLDAGLEITAFVRTPVKSSSIQHKDVAHFIVKVLTNSKYENYSIGLAI